MNAPITFFEEPQGLVTQEQASHAALERFEQALPGYHDRVDACTDGYAASAQNYRQLANLAQALATEMHRTAACFEIAVELAKREGMVDP